MSCVLRVFGSEFEVDEFLKNSSFSPCAIFHKGEPKSSRNNAKICEQSGFNLDVSSAEFNEFEEQMADAIDFLEQNKEEIKRLKRFPGVEGVGLDFAVDFPQDLFSKSFQLKDRLLKEVVQCGIEVEISVYKTEE